MLHTAHPDGKELKNNYNLDELLHVFSHRVRNPEEGNPGNGAEEGKQFLVAGQGEGSYADIYKVALYLFRHTNSP
jgi:hypothetical protein